MVGLCVTLNDNDMIPENMIKKNDIPNVERTLSLVTMQRHLRANIGKVIGWKPIQCILCVVLQ